MRFEESSWAVESSMRFFHPIRRLEEWPLYDQSGSQSSREWPHISETQHLLTPAYLFKGVQTAWVCSECGKLFSIAVDSTPAKPAQEIPDHVQAEFHRHSCALHFWGV
jgi:hypothetical protein